MGMGNTWAGDEAGGMTPRSLSANRMTRVILPRGVSSVPVTRELQKTTVGLGPLGSKRLLGLISHQTNGEYIAYKAVNFFGDESFERRK